METELIDRFFLELSQVTKARTKREIELERKHAELVNAVHKFLIAWPCDEDHDDPNHVSTITFDLIDELKRLSRYGEIDTTPAKGE